MKTGSVQSAQKKYSTTGCSLQGVHREEYCSVIKGTRRPTAIYGRPPVRHGAHARPEPSRLAAAQNAHAARWTVRRAAQRADHGCGRALLQVPARLWQDRAQGGPVRKRPGRHPYAPVRRPHAAGTHAAVRPAAAARLPGRGRPGMRACARAHAR